MAEALARSRFPATVRVESAGVDPADAAHPLAIEILRDEDGLDLRGHRPRPLTEVDFSRFDLVVLLASLSDEDALERVSASVERLHWLTEDPTAVGFDVRRDVWLDRFRDVRDALARRLDQLVARGHESFGPPGLR